MFYHTDVENLIPIDIRYTYTENVSDSSDNKYEQHTLYINVTLKEALIWKFVILF